MNEKSTKKSRLQTGKECAYLAVFVAFVIALQLSLTFLPGVEVVTVLFVAYASVFGVKRGMIAATAFSVLRQLIFGFFPTVLILYIVYYNLLAVGFGWLGAKVEDGIRSLWKYVVFACIGTVCFNVLDVMITPLWYGYTASATWAYFLASLPFMLPQVLCTALTVGFLYLPLQRAFKTVKKGLS